MLAASEEPGFAAHPWTPSLLLFRGHLRSLLHQAMVPADGEASWRAHYPDVQEVSEQEGPGSPSPPESSPSSNGHPSPACVGGTMGVKLHAAPQSRELTSAQL